MTGDTAKVRYIAPQGAFNGIIRRESRKVIMMKISKCKKELARIIGENGGWRNGYSFSAQGGDGTGSIDFFKSKPQYYPNSKFWRGVYDPSERIARADVTIKNFHQTILSRAEYFHLYPVPDAKPEFCESVMGTIPEPEAKPTIDQLLQDWRNADDLAKRKQAEADEAASMRDERWKLAQVKASKLGVTIDEAGAEKADADEKLRVLEIAGEAHGLLVTPITAKQEPEMVITVQVGDEVECIRSSVNPGNYRGRIGTVSDVDVDDTSTPYLVDFGGSAKIWCHEVKFIRRP